MYLGFPAGNLYDVLAYLLYLSSSLFFTLREKANIYDIIWNDSSTVSCSGLVGDVFVAFLENIFSSCASSWMHECFVLRHELQFQEVKRRTVVYLMLQFQQRALLLISVAENCISSQQPQKCNFGHSRSVVSLAL